MRIEHIAMYVNDLDRAKEFFEEYLGARPGSCYHNEKTGFSSCFLSFDDGARLELMNRPDMIDAKKEPHRTGYIHIAFSVGERAKVDALTRRLEESGYEIFSAPRTTGDGYYESCVVGVEGNLIEITV